MIRHGATVDTSDQARCHSGHHVSLSLTGRGIPTGLGQGAGRPPHVPGSRDPTQTDQGFHLQLRSEPDRAFQRDRLERDNGESERDTERARAASIRAAVRTWPTPAALALPRPPCSAPPVTGDGDGMLLFRPRREWCHRACSSTALSGDRTATVPFQVSPSVARGRQMPTLDSEERYSVSEGRSFQPALP